MNRKLPPKFNVRRRTLIKTNLRFNSIQCHGRFLFGWIPHLLVHVGCSGAIAIIVVGYLKLEGTDSTANVQKIGLDLIRGGGTILLIVWLGMSANMIVSYRYPRDLRGEKQVKSVSIFR